MEHSENYFAEYGLADVIRKLLKNNEDAVIVGPSSPMYEMAVSTGYCNWEFLDDQFYRDIWAFPLAKGSPFLSAFNNMWETEMNLYKSI